MESGPVSAFDSSFDDILEDISNMKHDTNRLRRVTAIISDCTKSEDWVSLMKVGLFLLSSPEQFCHHSCLLVATALCSSPYPHEAMAYMKELAARNIEPHPSCLVKIFNDLIKEGDHAALASAVLTLARLNVFVYGDVIEYAYSLCLRKGDYEGAEALLALIETRLGASYSKVAYYSLFQAAPEAALEKYPQFKAVGVLRPTSYASHMLAAGHTKEAADALNDCVRLDLDVDNRKHVFKALTAALLSEQSDQRIGHGTWNEAEKLVWGMVRRAGCTATAFEETMGFWSSVGSYLCPEAADVTAAVAPSKEPAGVDSVDRELLRDACVQRRKEVLLDMSRSGVMPKLSSFKKALRFDPALYEKRENAIEDMRAMSRAGSFQSLSGLWAGVMLAAEMKPAPSVELISDMLRDNIELAIEDTKTLLARRDNRGFRKVLIVDAKGAPVTDEEGLEVFRYEVEKIDDHVLQFAWTQLLSEFAIAVKMQSRGQTTDVFEEVVGEHFAFPRGTFSLWRYRTSMRSATRSNKKSAEIIPTRWFMERALRTYQNRQVLTEAFNMTLSYYLTTKDSSQFAEIAGYMVDNNYLDAQALRTIRDHCEKNNKMELYHSAIIDLAAGLCKEDSNPYGAKLLSDFTSTSPFFSCDSLQQRWKDTLTEGVRSNDLMLSEALAETMSHLTAQLAPPKAQDKLIWDDRVKVLDKLATVVIAQKTCGFSCKWVNLSSIVPAVFLDRKMRQNAQYRLKILNLAKLVLCTEHYDRRIPMRAFFTQFVELGFGIGFEQLWDTDAEFASLHGAQSEHIDEIMKIKCMRSAGDFYAAVDIFETGVLRRGVPFAIQLLQEKNAFNLYLGAHAAIIRRALDQGDEQSAAIVACEIQRFERIVVKLSDIGVLTKPELLNAVLLSLDADSFSPRTPVEYLWTLFVYVEKMVEKIESLPACSVPAPQSAQTTEQIEEIISTFNSTRRRFSKRPSDKAHNVTSLYPPNHLSSKDRADMLYTIKNVVESLAWLISPKDEELYSRFVSCKSRVQNMT